MDNQDAVGMMQSPGGFVFGVSGWVWGEPRAKAITFFLDGTAKVSDQHGRPIKGAVVDGKEVLFAPGPPTGDDDPANRGGLAPERVGYATHAQVIAALAADRVDWKTLSCAGFPQLPYKDLAGLRLPPTPLEELKKIRDPQLRKDALRVRIELDDARAKELVANDG